MQGSRTFDRLYDGNVRESLDSEVQPVTDEIREKVFERMAGVL